MVTGNMYVSVSASAKMTTATETTSATETTVLDIILTGATNDMTTAGDRLQVLIRPKPLIKILNQNAHSLHPGKTAIVASKKM